MAVFTWITRLTTCPADLRLDGPGDYGFEIVGEACYQDALEALRRPDGRRAPPRGRHGPPGPRGREPT